jgi:antagonist of KipI
MAIEILRPGILTTVRDAGRFGYRRFGVNTTGAMDPLAARIANILVGNDDRAAVIEIHFPAPEIRFAAETVFATSGAHFDAVRDGIAIKPWRTYRANAGSVLSFTERILGNRCYLAVAGGFDVPQWLGSSSTNLAAAAGGHHGRRLAAGDVIETRTPTIFPATDIAAGPSIIPRYHNFPTVRIVAGSEFDSLTENSRQAFLNSTFTVGQRSDLMGFRLEGSDLAITGEANFLSSAVDFGTIQLPSGGEPILLMSDHQTSGGYPRIGHVISSDLPLAAQLGPSDRIAFHLVDVSEAHSAMLELERDLRMLRAACRLRSTKGS